MPKPDFKFTSEVTRTGKLRTVEVRVFDNRESYVLHITKMYGGDLKGMIGYANTIPCIGEGLKPLKGWPDLIVMFTKGHIHIESISHEAVHVGLHLARLDKKLDNIMDFVEPKEEPLAYAISDLTDDMVNQLKSAGYLNGL